MALPSTPTAANWDSEFQTLANALDAIPDDEYDELTSPSFRVSLIAASESSASNDREMSILFTAPTDLILYQLSVSAIGLSGNTLTVKVEPAVPLGASNYATEALQDSLAQGVPADFPSLALTTSGTAVERSVSGVGFDGSTGEMTHALKKGKRYKLSLSLSSASTQPWATAAAAFIARGSRI